MNNIAEKLDKIQEQLIKESLIREYERKCEILEIDIKINHEHRYLEGYINGLEFALVKLGII